MQNGSLAEYSFIVSEKNFKSLSNKIECTEKIPAARKATNLPKQIHMNPKRFEARKNAFV